MEEMQKDDEDNAEEERDAGGREAATVGVAAAGGLSRIMGEPGMGAESTGCAREARTSFMGVSTTTS